ncbi:thiopeptide-type bacteriocin biosynthesis protein [Sediminibacillus sp. JSM 1682029]|uniref:thiopeptide-type bacteriocin biosynthesis protein n=1 Tax=Sediminibacillus sp. JSM 1682029 TaxID=3229857 RepID=UPI0035268154
MENTWKAHYIYFHHKEKEDRLIQILAKKMMALREKGEIEKWFFLRYWEGGPHIRMRYFSSRRFSEEYLFTDLRMYIANHPSPFTLTKQTYYENHKFDGEPIPMEQLEWYEEGEIIEKDYFPEYERYGGETLMPLTEELFTASSEFAATCIQASLDKHYFLRLMLVLAVMEDIAVTCKEEGLFGVPVSEFYENCFRSWQHLYDLHDLEYANDIKEGVKKNEASLKGIYKKIRGWEHYQQFNKSILNGMTKVFQHTESHQRLRSILYSHLHMFNNRVGITPEYECAIYYSLFNLGGVIYDTQSN